MKQAQKRKIRKKGKINLSSDEKGGKVAENNTKPLRVEIKPRHGKTGVTQVMEINLNGERIRKALGTSCPDEATEKVQPALLAMS